MPPLTLTGTGPGSFFRDRLPYALSHFVGTGQSLSVGGADTGNTAPTQPYHSLMLADSSGAFDITTPNASTLSLAPLVQPMRPSGNTAYPTNIFGQPECLNFANMLSRLGRLGSVFSSCVGSGGIPYSSWKKGGDYPAYAASLYEMRVAKRLAASMGFASVGLAAIDLLAGEADANNTSYAADLQQFWIDYNADAVAIYGSGQLPVPLLQSQQHSYPGGMAFENISGLQQWQASVANPMILLPCPKYWGPYISDGTHFSDYRQLAGYHVRAYLTWLRTGIWQPLWPTSFARVGTTVTIGFHVPVAPLVFDLTAPNPHQSGGFSAPWAAGNGLEAYEILPNITTITNATPCVATYESAHGLSNGDFAVAFSVGGNTAAAGCWPVTVVDALRVAFNGSSGNGAFTGAPIASIAAVPIASATVQGNSVIMVLGRLPRAGFHVANAHNPDEPQPVQVPPPLGRCSTLRDSDPTVSVDPITGARFPLKNWSIEFAQAVA